MKFVMKRVEVFYNLSVEPQMPSRSGGERIPLQKSPKEDPRASNSDLFIAKVLISLLVNPDFATSACEAKSIIFGAYLGRTCGAYPKFDNF